MKDFDRLIHKADGELVDAIEDMRTAVELAEIGARHIVVKEHLTNFIAYVQAARASIDEIENYVALNSEGVDANKG